MTQQMAPNVLKDWERKRALERYTVSIEAIDEAPRGPFAWRYRLHVDRGFLGYTYYGHSADRLARKGARIARRLNRRIDESQARQRALEGRS